jgi:hypothetical protein
MFQGSENAGKMMHIKLINSSGGVLNGSTDFDVTNYYQVVPSNALERVLWLEADRMRALRVDDENLRNQRDVVKEEVRVNVLNAPYGGFPWLDLPPIAFRNWANAHNFYGDFQDLDAATLEDVQTFFNTYYTPSNAVLVMAGDAARGCERAAARGGAARTSGRKIRYAAGAGHRLPGSGAAHGGMVCIRDAGSRVARGTRGPILPAAGARKADRGGVRRRNSWRRSGRMQRPGANGDAHLS